MMQNIRSTNRNSPVWFISLFYHSFKKYWGDSFLLFCVAILGCCGSLYIYQNFESHKSIFTNHGYTSPETVSSLLLASNQGEQHLKITKISDYQINVVFPSFSKADYYTLDFGDGEEKTIKEKSLSYQYKKSGEYKLSLSVMDKGVEKVVCNKKINLKES